MRAAPQLPGGRCTQCAGSSITAAAIRPAGLWEGGSGNDFSPLGEKKSVRLAARQLNAFRRVSEMGIKPMNSAAWRAGAPPTACADTGGQLPRHAKFCGCLSSCSKKCWMEEKGGLCATSLPPVFHGSQLMVRRRWRNSWFSVFSQIASMLEEMTQTAIPRSAQATSRSIISS